MDFSILQAVVSLLATISAYLVFRVVRSQIFGSPNPLAGDGRKPRRPYVTDQKARDKVLKQNFSIEKVQKGGNIFNYKCNSFTPYALYILP